MKLITRVLLLLMSCLPLALAGCDRLASRTALASSNEGAAQPVSEADAEEVAEELPHYDPEDGLICILFGYGFNSKEFYDEATGLLKDRYGLSSEDGIILPVTFPDDLKTRISNLYDIISENKIKGIILLGAPDNTHKTLSRLHGYWAETEVQAPPIFSLMPQDDILGEESNCDFVIEYERTNSVEAETEESAEPMDKTAEQIIIRAVRYMEDLAEPLAADGHLLSHVQAIVGEKKVRRYTDSETGLQAINHFVIEQ